MIDSSNPRELASLEALFRGLGAVSDEDSNGQRRDAAGDTLYLARELEYVSAETYDVLYDPRKGRQFVPMNMSVPEGAETYGYDMYDGFALCEWITNYASTVGQADAFKTRTSKTSRDFGGSYQYTTRDLAAATFAGGRPLDRERAKFNRQGHEDFIERLIATGDSTRGIEGLTNSTTIPLVAPAVGTWDASTTSAEKMKDLDKLVTTIENASAENFKADTLILPLAVKYLMRMPFANEDARTVEKVWLENQDSDGIKSIQYWKKLNTASALGGPRALCYKKSNMVFEFLGSFDYKELPPQAVGHAFVINTSGRVIGICFRYPFAMAQMDLDASP